MCILGELFLLGDVGNRLAFEERAGKFGYILSPAGSCLSLSLYIQRMSSIRVRGRFSAAE